MIKRIESKKESREFIENMDLNRVPEIFVDKKETEKIKQFFTTYKEDLYVVRDAEHSSAKYYYVTSYEECLEKIKNYSGRVIIAVSINTYKNKVLLGAIELIDDKVRICATTNEKLDHRTMYGGAEYSYETDIFDKKLSCIPEFDFLYGYLSRNRLIGVTVEFTIFDRKVGVKGEKIIINEVRNY